MSRRRTLLAGLALAVSVAVVASLLVASVGGADEPPTREEYLSQVEAICDAYGEKLDRIPPPGDLSSPGSVVESLQAAIPVLEEQERKIRSLERPVSLRVRLARFFELTDRSLAKLREALEAALRPELYPMAVALTAFGEVRDQAKKIAGEIGFDCQ